MIQVYPGGGPVRGGMESFGFPSHFHNTLHEFPLCKVNALLSGTLNLDEKDTDSQNNGRSEEQSSSSQVSSTGAQESSSDPQNMEVSADPAEIKKREEREKLREQKVSFDCFRYA